MWKRKSPQFQCVQPHDARISADDYQQMMTHVERCPSCRAAHDEFTSFLGQLPSNDCEAVNEELRRHVSKGGLRERFMERAVGAGIQFSFQVANRHPSRQPWTFPYGWVAAAAMLGVIVGAVSERSLKPKVPASLSPHLQASAVDGSRRRGPGDQRFEARLTELQASLAASDNRIAHLQEDNSAAVARMAKQEKYLAQKRSEIASLELSLDRLSRLSAQQATQSDANAQVLVRTQADLEAARAREKAAEMDLGAARSEVASLSQQMNTQEASLARERNLLAAGRDITDLMGARNLHVIDVRDADGKGKNKRSFGRIFYTEGKSLIFYAYDLDESKLVKAGYSFEVWGERLGEPTSVRSLGILYTDNKDQKRWAFKIDDPQQLAEIDSVFVTIESHQRDDRPRGGKILFAYLGGIANHP